MRNKHEWMMLTDVDGTLEYRCGGIGQAVIDSAAEYVAAGGGLALATGRSVLSTRKIATDLQINMPSIVFGGTMIYDFEKASALWTCPVSEEILIVVEDIAKRFGDVALIIYTDEGISIRNANTILWESGIPEETKREFLGKRIEGRILKFNMCGDREQVKRIRDTYFSGDEYDFAFSSYHFAEVVAAEAGKGKAMKVLAELTDTPLDRFIAMGDAQNDLEMLQLAKIAFTLENAADSIKQAADVVLPHCKQQGAAEGFLRAKRVLSDPNLACL